MQPTVAITQLVEVPNRKKWQFWKRKHHMLVTTFKPSVLNISVESVGDVFNISVSGICDSRVTSLETLKKARDTLTT